jgi:DNA-nicking Smr family endonuclease
MLDHTIMSKNPQPPKETDSLFQEAMRDISTLKTSPRHTPSKILPKPKPLTHLPQASTQINVFPISFENLIIRPPIASEATLLYGEHQLNARHLSHFKQGKYPIETRLDLHGYTVTQAIEKVSHFIEEARAQALRHLLIITGKGRQPTHPTIKTAVYYTLQAIPCVLAFCSAKPADGGAGSLYVLLKEPIF